MDFSHSTPFRNGLLASDISVITGVTSPAQMKPAKPPAGECNVPDALADHEDRKRCLEKLVEPGDQSKPIFLRLSRKKTELEGLSSDVPILRVVFEERVTWVTK